MKYNYSFLFIFTSGNYFCEMSIWYEPVWYHGISFCEHSDLIFVLSYDKTLYVYEASTLLYITSLDTSDMGLEEHDEVFSVQCSELGERLLHVIVWHSETSSSLRTYRVSEALWDCEGIGV